MTRNKNFSVSQDGKQSTIMTSAIDNMSNEIPPRPKLTSSKKGTTFSLDPELCYRFKAICAQQGKSMSSVVEELISKFIDNAR